ncbi:hypothetical protein EDD86DRAFT_210376 [Gorgonomyces haynaldii]|nr:hypothetical protein EDD86DRAFT_210376 [Gorgonomyces haynaldii]
MIKSLKPEDTNNLNVLRLKLHLEGHDFDTQSVVGLFNQLIYLFYSGQYEQVIKIKNDFQGIKRLQAKLVQIECFCALGLTQQAKECYKAVKIEPRIPQALEMHRWMEMRIAVQEDKPIPVWNPIDPAISNSYHLFCAMNLPLKDAWFLIQDQNPNLLKYRQALVQAHAGKYSVAGVLLNQVQFDPSFPLLNHWVSKLREHVILQLHDIC